jgi:hypothetical protein
MLAVGAFERPFIFSLSGSLSPARPPSLCADPLWLPPARVSRGLHVRVFVWSCEDEGVHVQSQRRQGVSERRPARAAPRCLMTARTLTPFNARMNLRNASSAQTMAFGGRGGQG